MEREYKAQMVANINATLKQIIPGIIKNQFRQIAQRIMQEMQLSIDIPQMNLSGIKMASIYKEVRPFLREFENVVILVITNNGLTNIDQLPSEWKLVSLDASCNKLGDSCLKKIGKYKGLKQLILYQNEIKKKQAFKSIFCLKDLIQIQIRNNPVSEKQDYKHFLQQNMPELKIDHIAVSSQDSEICKEDEIK